MPTVAKSKSQKIAQGTLRPCRENSKKIPISEKKLSVEPPTGLRSDAKDAWRMAITCAPKGVLQALDLSVLERWARNYALYRKVAREVEDEGVASQYDDTKLNAKFTALIRIQQALASCEKELGFTPVSRARVHAPEETNEVNEFDGF